MTGQHQVCAGRLDDRQGYAIFLAFNAGEPHRAAALFPELLTRRTINSDSMSCADTGHEHVSLTNRESPDSDRGGQPMHG
jgi:hypothetical protein